MRNLLYAAVLGAGLWILSEILEMASLHGSTPLSLWVTSIWHPILAVGFWGLHKRQSPFKNTLSLIAVIFLILSFIGFAPVSLLILNSSVDTFSEFLQQNPGFQIFGIFSLGGYILFGAAMLRTKFYPGWMAYLLLFFIVLSAVQNFAHLSELVQHVAFIGLSAVVILMALYGLKNSQLIR
jgi:prepilin signal peptidase PulO-like enzyme (type II secretory pathway)